MKPSLLIVLFLISFIGFSQNNYIVKTEDGRRVLLKADFTWEYIDAEASIAKNVLDEKVKTVETSGCNLAPDFKEPELDKSIQVQLKKGRATIEDIKKKVAKDHKCQVEDVVLLAASEDKAMGTYDFCVKATKVSYKRNGHAILKKKQLF